MKQGKYFKRFMHTQQSNLNVKIKKRIFTIMQDFEKKIFFFVHKLFFFLFGTFLVETCKSSHPKMQAYFLNYPISSLNLIWLLVQKLVCLG